MKYVRSLIIKALIGSEKNIEQGARNVESGRVREYRTRNKEG